MLAPGTLRGDNARMQAGTDIQNPDGLQLADGQQLLILMYHKVGKPPANARPRGLYTTPRQLRGHIRWLKKQNVRFTTFAELLAGPSDSAGSPMIILTFDDGHADNYTEAWPVLREEGVPAVIYPVVADIGRQGVDWAEADDTIPADLLSKDQILEMAAGGIEFGSHLMNHIRLTRLGSAEREAELSRSREELESLLGEPVISVAYPYGDIDDDLPAQAQAAGYQFGLTTIAGDNRAGAQPFLLKRLGVKGSRLHHPQRFRKLLRKHLEQNR